MTDKQQTDDLIALINEALESLEWNEADLARASGVSRPTINQFLKGKRGLSEEARSKVLAAIEKHLHERATTMESELTKKRGLSAEAAARIRGKANAMLDPRTDQAKVARDVLFATARYMRRHELNIPADIADIAAERIYHQHDQMFELMREGRSSEELSQALGIYIARLEISFAQFERRIAELEAQQNGAKE